MKKNNLILFENDSQLRILYSMVSGTDEAGRGPLAGPVVCASVILPESFYHPLINDSKKINENNRNELYDIIKEKALAYNIAIIDEKTIDRINILQATLLGMKQSLEALSIKPDLALIDGNKIPTVTEIKCQYVIGGDRLHASIASASILAKVTRDRIMDDYDQIYPIYGFKKHKGYPTPEHLNALRIHGICPIHRLSYKPVMQLTIEDLLIEQNN